MFDFRIYDWAKPALKQRPCLGTILEEDYCCNIDVVNVALYLRQSLDATGLQAAVNRQRDEGAALCLTREWQWVEYMDNDTSAFNLRKPRPQYRQMLQSIKAGEIKGIVCWHPDRLYRHLSDLQELIDVCNEHNVAIETVRGGEVDLSTPMGRLVARILGSVSMGEMEQKSDRQKFMHRQRAKAGRHFWARRPFGYIKTRDEHGKPGQAELHPTEAPLLREAYEKVLAGVSVYSIMQEWNTAGITTTTGRRWTKNLLPQILRNPRNAALLAHTTGGKTEIVGKGTWPEIVPENVYGAVLYILGNPERNTFAQNGAKVRKHLLVSIARCKCGAHVVSAKTRRGKAAYTCHECHSFVKATEFIDNKIIELVSHRLAMPDAKQLFQRKDIDLTAIATERGILNKQLEDAEADHDKSYITGKQLHRKTEYINQRQAELTAKETDALRAKLYAGVIGADNTEKAFRERPLDQQRAMIADMMTITILPGHRGRPLTDAIFDDVVKIGQRKH